jgi:hypothetical protein
LNFLSFKRVLLARESKFKQIVAPQMGFRSRLGHGSSKVRQSQKMCRLKIHLTGGLSNGRRSRKGLLGNVLAIFYRASSRFT